MTVRFVRLALFSMLALVLATPAYADWIRDFCHSVVRDTKRRNCWPQPFVVPDREAVRAPFAVMVHNGWRRQNLLADYHFDAESQQLTDAGRARARWVATQAPLAHRTIYVRIAPKQELTAARMQSVQNFIAQIVPEGQPPAIQVTSIANPTWPASRADAVGRQFESSVPAPRLMRGGRGGGGGGGGGN